MRNIGNISNCDIWGRQSCISPCSSQIHNRASIKLATLVHKNGLWKMKLLMVLIHLLVYIQCATSMGISQVIKQENNTVNNVQLCYSVDGHTTYSTPVREKAGFPETVRSNVLCYGPSRFSYLSVQHSILCIRISQ